MSLFRNPANQEATKKIKASDNQFEKQRIFSEHYNKVSGFDKFKFGLRHYKLKGSHIIKGLRNEIKILNATIEQKGGQLEETNLENFDLKQECDRLFRTVTSFSEAIPINGAFIWILGTVQQNFLFDKRKVYIQTDANVLKKAKMPSEKFLFALSTMLKQAKRLMHDQSSEVTVGFHEDKSLFHTRISYIGKARRDIWKGEKLEKSETVAKLNGVVGVSTNEFNPEQATVILSFPAENL